MSGRGRSPAPWLPETFLVMRARTREYPSLLRKLGVCEDSEGIDSGVIGVSRESDAEAVIQAIRSAFHGVALEDGVSMSQARVKDDWGTWEVEAKARELDKETGWEEISDEKIEELSDILPFLDSKGFRFYIPAYMIWSLRHPESTSWVRDGTVYSLDDHSGKGSIFEYDESIHKGQIWRFALLSEKQSRAVYEFLRYIEKNCDGFSEDASAYITTYWGRFAPES